MKQKINGKLVTVQPGELIFIREGDFHELWANGILFLNAAFDLPTINAFVYETGLENWFIQACSHPMPTIIRLSGDELTRLRAAFTRAASRLSWRPATLQLLSTLIDCCADRSVPHDLKRLPSWLSSLLITIEESHGVLSPAECAARCQRDSATVARCFRHYLGMTTTEWLHRQRLQRAVDLLLTTDKALVHIAMDLGYSSQAHFSRRFSQQFGVSPGAYRRSHGLNLV